MSDPRAPILLLNCRDCDDILRIEDMRRTCLCGKCYARFVPSGIEAVGPYRVLEIPIEEYDGAAPGENRKWRITTK